MYDFKCPTKGIHFYDFIYTETCFDDIKYKKKTFVGVEKNKKEFESKLMNKWIGGNKSNKQLSQIENIVKFCKSQKEVIRFYNDYFKMIHKTAYDLKHGKGRKIITNAKSTWLSNSRYIWKLTKWNSSNHILFVLRNKNY